MRKPDWLKVRLGQGPQYARTARLLRDGRLHTVCQEAQCPNQGTCWEHGRATVMILGDACTRQCRFCAVGHAPPGGADPDEPRRVAEAVADMGLRDVVVTSVTRDDLPDGGAGLWAETVRRIRARNPEVSVEVLVPDFGGCEAALEQVAAAEPAVFGHNMETVAGLYPRVRPHAEYRRSLGILTWARQRGLVVKTGIMAGLGETTDDMDRLIADIADAGAEILFIGQYLRPSRRHWPVARYAEPAEFERWRDIGRGRGLAVVVSAPLVRSSYHSEEQSEYLARHLSGRSERNTHEPH